MVYALGLGEMLVGVSHECDFPTGAKCKPVVSRPAIELEGLSLPQIDAAIAERTRRGESIYRIDERLLRDLRPDLILTQDLCHVCAPSGNELRVALESLETTPRVLFMSPRSLAEIERNLCDLAAETGKQVEASALVTTWHERVARVRERTRDAKIPRVLCLEWVDPIFGAGHWIPEMVEIAGGVDAFGRKNADSVRVAWEDVIAWVPEVIVVAPCGFHLQDALAQTATLRELPGWNALPAVRNGKVYAVDADAYVVRPGPRVIDGIELLAHVIHPECCTWSGPQAHAGVLEHRIPT